MASYQARQRDPLLDQTTQAAIERRGKELLGIALLVAGAMTVMLLASYSPEDPSWLAATDRAPQNLLGRFGAAIASPLVVIAGHGAWAVALILATWGGRLVAHRGEDRAPGRVIFAPISVALLAVYASTHVAGPGWTHSFGLGGLFGDTVLGAILGVVPVSASFGLKLLSLVVGVAALAMLSFVLGLDRREMRAIARFLLVGTVVAYETALRGLGMGARGGIHGLRALQDRARTRREAARASAAMALDESWMSGAAAQTGRGPRTPVLRAEPQRAEPRLSASRPATPALADEPVAARPAGGLLARLPGLLRRTVMPVTAATDGPGAEDALRLRPELVEPVLSRSLRQAAAPSSEQINQRIAEAIRARQVSPAADDPMPVSDLRVEPPLTGAASPIRQAVAAARNVFAGSAAAGPAPLAGAESDFDLNAFADLDGDDGADGLAAPAFLSSRGAPGASRGAEMPRPIVQHNPRKAPAPSRQAMAEAQPRLDFDTPAEAGYEPPPLSLLASPATVQRQSLSDEALEENARMLESVLDDYGVKGEIVSVRPGPVVTMYELEPAPGLKASRVIGLADDIARSMSALSARVSTVPGRTVIGIELPNAFREKVVLREILSAREYGDSGLRLPLALGKDIAGAPVVANLAKMPHLLIAGTTGSGKSVAINTMILSLLYKLTPEECRLIMIDPKMLELSVYDGIPHLLSPVVTDPKKAVVALKWVVGEMEERYRKMSKMGVRNIEGFNGRVREALARGELFKRTVQTGFDEETGEPIFETEEFAPVALPYIVVIVDEMADLMMVAGKEIEACIQRLAQMARASGIHLIMATQRPSVDVITGTIKANFPTRISFQVTSKIDSRTILGEMGAEQLLGMGDMLYMAGGSRITRIHGPFVSDEEVEEIVNHLKSFGPPEYMSGVVEGPDDDREGDIDLVLGLGGNTDVEDALYDTAVQVVLKDRKVSTSYIQRKLGIGYNKAARLVEQMEEQGLVSPANHVGKREILVPEG
ncbi:MAG: DNA translocase FtsK [Alphaproteobacteria bacterium HGW-Alphaproteobacteria-6]|nr:MAG: DNA translocase FtsK [Alphaproteobacteria bacterium HGW-Alphaproteobacteria-6]